MVRHVYTLQCIVYISGRIVSLLRIIYEPCSKLVRVDKVAKYTETPRTLFLHPQDKCSWLVLPVDLHAGPDTKTLSAAHLIRTSPHDTTLWVFLMIVAHCGHSGRVGGLRVEFRWKHLSRHQRHPSRLLALRYGYYLQLCSIDSQLKQRCNSAMREADVWIWTGRPVTPRYEYHPRPNFTLGPDARIMCSWSADVESTGILWMPQPQLMHTGPANWKFKGHGDKSR